MNGSERLAVVTGANGSIGKELTRQLVEQNIPVRALVRPGKVNEVVQLPGVTVVEGTLDDSASLQQAFAGATEIYHTIASFHHGAMRGRDYKEAVKVNVDGTRNVLKAAEESGIKRLVSMSTNGVYGLLHGEITEDAPRKGKGIYAETKKRAEDLLRKEARNVGVTIVRPASVLGPEADIWSELLYQHFKARKRFLLGKGKGVFPTVDIRDVAKGMIEAADKPEAVNQTYNLVTDRQMTFKELADYYKIVTQVEPKLTQGFLGIIGGLIFDKYSWIRGKAIRLTLNNARVAQNKNWHISNEKAKKEIGIEFTPVEQTMKDTLLWLNDKHELGKEKVIYDYFVNKEMGTT